MKKSKLILFGILATFIAFQSCELDDDGPFKDCEEGDGPAITKVLNMPEFRGFNLDINAEVHLSQGPEFYIEARGEENIIDLLELDVQNDFWKIEFERCVEDYDLKLFITMPHIDILKIDGSGEIIGENLLIGENLVLDIDGSGDMYLEVDIEKEIDGDIDGSGEIWLQGIAEKVDWSIDGSGDIEAFDLTVRKAEIEIDGGGNASLYITDLLEVNIDGSGKVYYKGNPTLDVEIDGSGDVVDAN